MWPRRFGGGQTGPRRADALDCTSVLETQFGNNLSYVPAGALDPSREVGTFVTTNDGGALDELKALDPSTGAVLQDWGALDVPCVFGLAYWGGTAFGFTCEGDIVSIDFDDDQVSVTLVEATNIPFAGAGSSTKAPIVPEG